MTEIPPELDLENPNRGRWGCLFLAVPISISAAIVFGYGGLFVAGVIGRAPTGDRLRVSFHGCPEAPRDLVP